MTRNYEIEYEYCEKQEYKYTNEIQDGFYLITFDNEKNIIGYSSNITELYDINDIKSKFNEEKPEEEINEVTSIVSVDNSKWFKHISGNQITYERPIVNEYFNYSNDINSLYDDNLYKFFHNVCKYIKDVFNVTRVMIYKFDDIYCGEVISEVIDDDMEPYIGLKYPPTDIPKVVRNMFLDIHTRHIFSIKRTNKQIKSSEKINLKYCLSRSVSPFHIKYLENMGSDSTSSLSLIVNGKLWGLISIHTNKDTEPSINLCHALKIIYKDINVLLNKILENEKEISERKLKKMGEKISNKLSQDDNLINFSLFSEYSLQKITGTNGVSIVLDDNIINSGLVPGNFITKDLCKKYKNINLYDTIYSQSFDQEIIYRNDKNNIAGFCIVKIGDNSFIIFYKKEENLVINWGGDPRNNNFNDKEQKFIPRTSFKIWTDYVKNKCSPWTNKQQGTIDTILKVLRKNEEEVSKLFKSSLTNLKINNIKNKVLSTIDTMNNMAICVEKDITLNNACLDKFSLLITEREVDGGEFKNIFGFEIENLENKKYVEMFVNNGIRNYEIIPTLFYESFDYKIFTIEFKDVTEYKRVQKTFDSFTKNNENQIKKIYSSLKEKKINDEKIKTDFFDKLNHELRTPLNIVIGFSDLLLGSTFDNGSKDTIQFINNAAKDLNKVISKNLFNSSNINSIDKKEYSNFNIYSLIETNIKNLSNQIEKQNIEIKVNGGELNIFSHRKAMSQIIMNILTNAIKYNYKNGSIEIDVYQKGYYIHVEIKDTGIGMTPEQVEKCTLSYTRFNKEIDGAGMGLTISKNLVEILQGEMIIKSKKSEGTTVELKFPIKS